MAEPPAHVSMQVEPEQVTEQLPVQVTLQVAPPLQVMLPLLPSVTSQVASSHWRLALSPTVKLQIEPPAQWALHDAPQEPSQWLFWGHWRSALWVLLHMQDAPALQVHDEPVQVQPGPGQAEVLPEDEPQPRKRTMRKRVGKAYFIP
jgi:hypothetical protein